MPGTEVLIDFVSPPLAWPGLGSKVSNWLGPPAIQRRMQAFPALRRAGALVVTTSCQLRAPTEAAAGMNFRKSRRWRRPRRMETEDWRWRDIGFWILDCGLQIVD